MDTNETKRMRWLSFAMISRPSLSPLHPPIAAYVTKKPTIKLRQFHDILSEKLPERRLINCEAALKNLLQNFSFQMYFTFRFTCRSQRYAYGILNFYKILTVPQQIQYNYSKKLLKVQCFLLKLA